MMDPHVPRAITEGVRREGIDVLMACEDDSHELEDPALWSRATELERVLVSFDDDLLVEASRRQREGDFFYGLIFAQFSRISIGQWVSDLLLIARAATGDDVNDQVIFLPI